MTKKTPAIKTELDNILKDLSEAKKSNKTFQWHNTIEYYYGNFQSIITQDERTEYSTQIQSIENLISRTIREGHHVTKTYVKTQQNTVANTPSLKHEEQSELNVSDARPAVEIPGMSTSSTEASTDNGGQPDQLEKPETIENTPSVAPEIPAKSNTTTPSAQSLLTKEELNKRKTMLEPIREAMKALKEQELLLKNRKETVVSDLISDLYTNIDNANATYESGGNLAAYKLEMNTLLGNEELRDKLSTHRGFAGKAITKIVDIVNNILEALAKVVVNMVSVYSKTTGINNNLFFNPIKTRSQERLENVENAFKNATGPKK